jgi:hypothetical protein
MEEREIILEKVIGVVGFTFIDFKALLDLLKESGYEEVSGSSFVKVIADIGYLENHAFKITPKYMDTMSIIIYSDKKFSFTSRRTDVKLDAIKDCIDNNK